MTPNGVGSGLRLVLASASPRRRQILESLAIGASWVDPDIDETPRAGESPAVLVERLAREKALAGLALAGGHVGSGAAAEGAGVVVIGADTTVALGEESFGKPEDDDEARAMLRRLSGRSHQVLTGVAVAMEGRCRSAVDAATVVFRHLDEDEIEVYVATGEPRGKAGAYAIQGRGGLFVPRIEGSHHTVIGLPIVVLDELCRSVAGRPLRHWAELG